MENSSPFDLLVYNILRIINSLNLVLFASVLLAYSHVNKYLSFIILIGLAGLIVLITRYVFDVVLKINDESIESTLVYKGLSIFSLVSTVLYFAYKKEFLFILIMLSIFALFAVLVKFLTKNKII